MSTNIAGDGSNLQQQKFRKGFDQLLQQMPATQSPAGDSDTPIKHSWWTPPHTQPVTDGQWWSPTPHHIPVKPQDLVQPPTREQVPARPVPVSNQSRLLSLAWARLFLDKHQLLLEAARRGVLRWMNATLCSWKVVLVPQLLSRVQLLSRAAHNGWSGRMTRRHACGLVARWRGNMLHEHRLALERQFGAETVVLTGMGVSLRSQLGSAGLAGADQSYQELCKSLECHSNRVTHLERDKAAIRHDAEIMSSAVVALEEDAVRALTDAHAVIEQQDQAMLVLNAQAVAAAALTSSLQRKLESAEQALREQQARVESLEAGLSACVARCQGVEAEAQLDRVRKQEAAVIIQAELRLVEQALAVMGTELEPVPWTLTQEQLCQCSQGSQCGLNLLVHPGMRSLSLGLEAAAGRTIEKQSLQAELQRTQRELTMELARGNQLEEQLRVALTALEQQRQVEDWLGQGLNEAKEQRALWGREHAKLRLMGTIADWKRRSEARVLRVLARECHEAAVGRAGMRELVWRLKHSMLQDKQLLLQRRIHMQVFLRMNVVVTKQCCGRYLQRFCEEMLLDRVELAEDAIMDETTALINQYETKLAMAESRRKAENKLLSLVDALGAGRQLAMTHMMTYWKAVTHCTSEITQALDAMYKTGRRNAACRVFVQFWGDWFMMYMLEAFHVWCGLCRK